MTATFRAPVSTLLVLVAAAACARPGDDGGTGTPGASAPAAPATSSVAAPPSGPPPGGRYRYVALGDSFAALGAADSPTTGPRTCFRAVDDYAGLLAADPRIASARDVSCGGARTVDMTAAQIPGAPPQFDALDPATTLVTLSIGGNDIGFGDIAGCIRRSLRPAADTPGPVAPCRELLSAQVGDALDRLGPALDAVHRGIRDRSPEARVVVTRYLPLVPAEGGCGFTDRVAAGDLEWVRAVVDRLDGQVRAAASRAGAADVLPPEAVDHSACAAPEGRYADFTGAETGSHPMHPTRAGHRAMAAAVADTL